MTPRYERLAERDERERPSGEELARDEREARDWFERELGRRTVRVNGWTYPAPRG